MPVLAPSVLPRLLTCTRTSCVVTAEPVAGGAAERTSPCVILSMLAGVGELTATPNVQQRAAQSPAPELSRAHDSSSSTCYRAYAHTTCTTAVVHVHVLVTIIVGAPIGAPSYRIGAPTLVQRKGGRAGRDLPYTLRIGVERNDSTCTPSSMYPGTCSRRVE